MEDDSFVDTLDDLIHEALQDVSSYHETIRQTTAIQHDDDDDDDEDDSKQSESDDGSYQQNLNDAIISSLQQKFELLSISEDIELTTNRMDILMNDILRNNNVVTDNKTKRVSSSSSLSSSDEEDGMKYEWKRLKHIEATLGEELKMNGSFSKSHDNKQIVDVIQYIMQHVIPKCCNTNTTLEEMIQTIVIIGQIIVGGIHNLQSFTKIKIQNKSLNTTIDLEQQQHRHSTCNEKKNVQNHDNNQDHTEYHQDDKSFFIYTRIIILQLLKLQYLIIKFIFFHKQKQIQRRETNLFQQVVGWSWDRVIHPIETIHMAWDGIHWSVHTFQKHQHNIINILHSTQR